MKNSNNKVFLDFEPISRRLIITPLKSFYQALLDSNIQINSLCGGKGTCGKCKVQVQKGIEYLNDPTNSEKKFLTQEELNNGWRLACQAEVKKESLEELKKLPPPQIRVYLPEDLLLEDFKILTSSKGRKVSLNPNVRKFSIEIEAPTLDDPIPDFERTIKELIKSNLINNENINISLTTLRKLPSILRNKKKRITLTLLDDKEIIDCELNEEINNNFGIAIDIGTTTIVGYLINLNDGKIYAVSSLLNPQTAFGEDVITRITYVKDNENGLNQLQDAVIRALNSIIMKACNKARVSANQIYEATIVGNSVMHHLFLGINPINIGLSPYVPAIQRNTNFKAKELNLKINPEANIHVLPVIAGFVGADTIGVILASEIHEQDELTLAIDIGTNGEIIIGNSNVLATGSCAAGSALEGSHIKNGMRAAGGAIDTIKINPDDLSVSYTTIKNKKPIGICGSGLIDAVAEMLRAKIISRSGSFNKALFDNERFIVKDKHVEFIIAKKDETGTGQHVSLTQEDIREIQMAKGAFYSGMRIIMNYLKSKHEKDLEIKQIFLAGAFGNYIKKENAKFIGMIPDLPDDKIYQIGNAAGLGAQYCLMNKNYRKKAMTLLNKIEYVEIATKQEFQKEFAEAMYFPHMKLEYFPSLSIYKEIPRR